MNIILFSRSAWIDESNIKPYLEYKTEMVKLGKPKNKFDVAIAEIEAYIKNPAVIIHQNFQQESSMNCFNYNRRFMLMNLTSLHQHVRRQHLR